MRLIKSLCIIFLTMFNSCNTIDTSKETGRFTNPILAGFYPDPSICSVHDDYYLVNSSFAYFPGIPIFHSKDLVNWKLLGHVLDRPEQLPLDGAGVSRGLFAPAISYNKGVFYVVCTLVDAGGNFVVTSQNPEGPWSNPVWIPEINGIDPSLYFDDDNKSYIVFNSIPPDNKSLYDGHRTIRMYEFDSENLKVVGEQILLVNGGVHISKKPVWIEAPHIYKNNDYYYLLCAEGGTADQHSEVVFRSASIIGPYLPYEKNPILTQRHLDTKRENPITSTGHADLIRIADGGWWAVFLGCRPYRPFEKGYYNIGRETFLAPVEWIDGWPVINPGFEEVQYHYPLPIKPVNKSVDIPYNGNFTIRDEFDKQSLHPSWVFLRTLHEKWYTLDSNSGVLKMQLRPETCSGKKNPSFIARRQQHIRGSVSTSMKFSSDKENEKAGLLVFQNEKHYYFLCKSLIDGKPVVALYKSTNMVEPATQLDLIKSSEIPEEYIQNEIYLKIESNGNKYSFYYGYLPDEWISLKEHVDAIFLRAIIPYDFAGAMYALYATSLGEPSTNIANFDWFEYRGDDEVYNSDD
jgi:xylan 1,4-beta-xylosidase